MLVGITAANDTLYGSATSPANLFAQGQHKCNCNFTLTIGMVSKKKDYETLVTM